MTDHRGLHEPTPEFRAALAREIGRAYRRDAYPAPPARATRLRHLLAVAAALAFGLVLGAGTKIATAQVRESRQREELEGTMASRRQLAQLRLDIARRTLEDVRRRVAVGVVGQRSLAAAELEVRAMELALQRVHLDLQEARAAAAPPRDELWAPLVDGRDFVRERLMLEAALAQQRLVDHERALADLAGAVRVGAASRNAAAEAELERARAELELAAQKLTLRRQFLDERLPADEVARREQHMALVTEIRHTQRAMQLALEQAKLARGKAAVGAIQELDAKRAEVEALEAQITLERLRLQLQALDKRARP